MSKNYSVEDWLAGLGAPAADRDYKPGHARMHDLLAGMALSSPALRIRVAGTNGKGSTAHMLAAGLGAAGLSVGLYTSPHIHRFNERIRIDGMVVADEELLRLLPGIVEHAMRIGASYFEVATALALSCFSSAGVDVEVLEAGVGARLDATTAVEADMGLLTPVALDHQAWLGECIEEVAREKVHVFDGCRFSLSAAQSDAVRGVLDARAGEVVYADAAEALSLAMRGAHQQSNAALALAAVAALQDAGCIDVGEAVTSRIRQAVAETVVPGRMQQVCAAGKTFWLDAAHNRHALEALLPTLQALKPFDAVFVFSREDRDLRDGFAMLRGLGRRLVAGRSSVEVDACYDSVEEALASECLQPYGRYLVLGSFITVASATAWLESGR